MPHGVVKKKYQIIWNKKEIFNSCLSTPLPSREEPRFPQWEMDPAPGLLFSHSVVSDSETPWTAAHQACLSLTISQSLLRLISIKSVIPSNHLILCHSLLLLPSILPSIRVFSNELVLRIRRPKYWSFNFSISPSNEYLGFISFRINWFDLLKVTSGKTVLAMGASEIILKS